MPYEDPMNKTRVTPSHNILFFSCMYNNSKNKCRIVVLYICGAIDSYLLQSPPATIYIYVALKGPIKKYVSF
jgi:hypothetical protein